MSSLTNLLNPDSNEVADTRETDYAREEPTTPVIREPEEATPDDSPRRPSLPLVKTEKSELEVTRPTAPLHSPLAALKHEHSSHTQSPLRESSVPVPSTEMAPVSIASAPAARPKKRPPKSQAKKGTASAVKKEPSNKKRKVEVKRSGTPSLQKPKAGTKRITSTSATPANSSPAPRSVRSTPPRSSPSVEDNGEMYSEDEEDEEDEDEDQGTPDPDAELYCLCRRPDTGTFMIGCDGGCDDWFHGKCVGIAERDKGLIDRYICPTCTENDRGVTTWKRMCRRRGCRMPARVGGAISSKGKKGKKEPVVSSKYCSEACGEQFFREQLTRARGGVEASPSKSKSQRKNAALDDDDDLGPRGGIISAAELKALVEVAPDVEAFKRLGEGVLSPPITPKANHQTSTTNNKAQATDGFTDAERERVTVISREKDEARARHALLKDRIKFVTMLKSSATTEAEERGMKPKEFCGFDVRVLWTEDELDAWRCSPEGAAALRTGTLARPDSTEARLVNGTDAHGDTDMANGGDHSVTATENTSVSEPSCCTKKRCARHHEWAKLAIDEARFEIGANSENMRGLDREEKDVRERAGLRVRELRAGGVGGRVEVHDGDSGGAGDGADAGKGGHGSGAEEGALGASNSAGTKVMPEIGPLILGTDAVVVTGTPTPPVAADSTAAPAEAEDAVAVPSAMEAEPAKEHAQAQNQDQEQDQGNEQVLPASSHLKIQVQMSEGADVGVDAATVDADTTTTVDAGPGTAETGTADAGTGTAETGTAA